MRFRTAFAASCVAAALLAPAFAADPPAESPASATTTNATAELQRLKDLLAKQQEQIETLRSALEAQKKQLESLERTQVAGRTTVPSDRLTASSVPMIVPSAAGSTSTSRSLDTPLGPPAAPPQQNAVAGQSNGSESYPTQLRIGNVGIMPVGFMDATAVWRDRDAGSSIGSNFGSIPFNNTQQAKLTEFRFSPQNSRLGFRIDGDWKGTHFIGYNEFDFLGQSGSTALGVTNGAFVPRIRLYWLDVRRGEWELLGGQSWSMMTPSRKGISALPGDLFYSQVIDVNYMIGLPWTRQPGFRVLYHPSPKATVGLSFENPNQYIGGSGGGPTVVLPAGLTGLAGSQLDNASNVLVTPNLHPDIIAKVAFDPNAHVHFEVAGIERSFRVWNPSTNVHSTIAGGAGAVNGNFEVVKNFRLVTNNFWGAGGGRYLFGNAPDLVVRANGNLSPIHSGGFVEGFEWTVKNWLLYSYYGLLYAQKNVTVDANGSLVGYGYRGSANSQNRSINEFSFGFNQTLWKDPRYGAINFMGQYEFLTRRPWFVAVNSPKEAHDNTIYINLRYTLPGSPYSPK